MMTQAEAREIAERARVELLKLYGPRLRGVYLFGSCAKGTIREDSDVDIAIVLDQVPDLGTEIERTGELFSSLGLQYGVVVSRVFVPAADFETGRYALYRAIRREGVSL